MKSYRVPQFEITVTKCEIESLVRVFQDSHVRDRISELYGKADTSLTTTGLKRAINKIEQAKQAIECAEARAKAGSEMKVMALRAVAQRVAKV